MAAPVTVTVWEIWPAAPSVNEEGDNVTDGSDELTLTRTGDADCWFNDTTKLATLPGEVRSSVRLVGVAVRSTVTTA